MRSTDAFDHPAGTGARALVAEAARPHEEGRSHFIDRRVLDLFASGLYHSTSHHLRTGCNIARVFAWLCADTYARVATSHVYLHGCAQICAADTCIDINK